MADPEPETPPQPIWDIWRSRETSCGLTKGVSIYWCLWRSRSYGVNSASVKFETGLVSSCVLGSLLFFINQWCRTRFCCYFHSIPSPVEVFKISHQNTWRKCAVCQRLTAILHAHPVYSCLLTTLRFFYSLCYQNCLGFRSFVESVVPSAVVFHHRCFTQAAIEYPQNRNQVLDF